MLRMCIFFYIFARFFGMHMHTYLKYTHTLQWNRRILFVLLCCAFLGLHAYAAEEEVSQDENKTESKGKVEIVAIKNNLLYDAAATPNLQLEFRLAPKWSLELGTGFNPFPLDDTRFPKWRHISVWVAPRYWFCNVFNKGFISINAAYAHYNVAGNAYPIAWMYKQVKDYRYQGDAVMAGASFGWHFPISTHFSIELEGGVDAGYSWYDQFECKHCGDKTADGGRWFVLPKLGVNLSFPLGGDKESLAKRCDCEKLATAAEEIMEEATEVVEETPVTEEPVEEPAPVEEEPAPIVEEPAPVEEEPIPVVVPVPVEPVEEEPEPEYIPAETIVVTPAETEAPVIPVVPVVEIPKTDNRMTRLRNRLLRDEEEYEPYDITTALSADPRNVFLFFDVNVTKMDRSFIQNDMLMDSIMNILGEALADTTLRISHIQIVGFASFDGRLAYNENLASSRARTIKEYMQSNYPQLQDSIFAVENGGESWAELRYQLEKVDFIGKDDVLQIIDTEPDPDKREALIKKLNGGATYRYMRDELKRILRNLGCITIYCENVE